MVMIRQGFQNKQGVKTGGPFRERTVFRTVAKLTR